MSDVTLDADQRRGVTGMVDAPVLCLTGGPGTGKTTTVREGIKALEAADQRYILLAPTGKAALRLSNVTGRPATTIHRLLYSQRCDETLSRVQVALIDESSMVDTEIMGDFSRAMVRNGLPRLILVGDPNQLPPVGPGRPFEDTLLSKRVETVELKTIHRQKGDSWVIDNAYRVLAGEMVSLEPTKDFTFIETDRIAEEALSYLAKQYAHKVDPNSYQVLSPQRREGDSFDNGATTERINRMVQAADKSRGGVFTFEWGSKLREGDRVIQTKNNYEAGVVNGQQGTVVQATSDGVLVRFEDLGVDDTENSGIWYSDFQEKAPSPTELELAYAVTVHKAQGSEWADIFLVCDKLHTRMLQRRLFYTAITRTRNHLTLVGSVDAIQRAVKTNTINDRNTLLLDKLNGKYDFHGAERPAVPANRIASQVSR
jgi:exodeoxyribonuclease V alpha subunit